MTSLSARHGRRRSATASLDRVGRHCGRFGTPSPRRSPRSPCGATARAGAAAAIGGGSVVAIDAGLRRDLAAHSRGSYPVRRRCRWRRALARGCRRAHGAPHRAVLARRRDACDRCDTNGHRVRRGLGLGRQRPTIEGHAVHRPGGHGRGASRSDDTHRAGGDRSSARRRLHVESRRQPPRCVEGRALGRRTGLLGRASRRDDGCDHGDDS